MEVEKVQNIAFKFNKNGGKTSVDSIPLEFIRAENEQPAMTTMHGSVLEVPTIDINDFDEERVVSLISKASEEWGLFQIVNHGIPTQVIHNLQRVGKEFFELPQEEKEVYAKPPPGYQGAEGYGTKLSNKRNEDDVSIRSWVDHLFHNIWPPSAINYHFWPKNPPSYRYFPSPLLLF